MKRTERHHLKEDEMVSGLGRFVHFYNTWQREIMIFAGVLGVVILVFGTLFLVRAHAASVRSRVVGEIMDLSADLEQKPENMAKLESLAASGSGSRLAGLEIASYWVGKADYAKAETYLGRIPTAPKDLLYYQAQSLEARILVARKEFDKAIALYKKIQADNPKTYPLDAILFHLAEAYELRGDTKAALEIYQKLQADYSQSYYGYEASQKVSRLGLQKQPPSL